MPPSIRLKWKLCLVGSSGVGKTSLIRRFVVDQFDDRYIQTLGTKVSKKSVDVIVPGSDVPVSADFAIWDIMGQPSFMDLLKDSFFTGASGVVGVADLTRRSTLQDLGLWIGKVHEVAGPVPVVVAVNKSDLTAQAQIAPEDIQRSAAVLQCEYFLTSAKSGDHVEDVFAAVANLVARYMLARPAYR